jgi:hypothetical protein
MNKFFEYFNNKYSYSREDLTQVCSEEFSNFFEMMKNRGLVDIKKDSDLSLMEKEIDKFMDEVIYHNNRRRRRG